MQRQVAPALCPRFGRPQLPSPPCAAKSMGVSRTTPSRQAVHAPSQPPVAAALLPPKSSAVRDAPPPFHGDAQEPSAADKTSSDGDRGAGASGLDDRAMGELAHMRLLVIQRAARHKAFLHKTAP
jgi:hypothetical protein